MRAVRASDGIVRIESIPSPVGPGVKVRVSSAGICGSDLHLVEANAVGVTLGHEVSGITENGTPVALEPLAPCGSCEPCIDGEYNLCQLGGGMIFGIGIDGGMADEVLVPERTLVKLPAGVDVANASLVEPLAVVIHAIRRANPGPRARVAVVGGGTIGLCAVAVAKARGCDVALVARHDHQREAGARLGADEATGHFDLVIEAAGSETALTEAVALAKPGAQVAIPGVYWGPVTMPGLDMCLRQVSLCPSTIYGRHAGGRDIDNAAALLGETPEIADSIITHRFPLDAAVEAFEAAADRAAGAIKVILQP